MTARLNNPSGDELPSAMANSPDLYAQKLITYVRGADDARVKRLSLTTEGRKLEGRLAALQRAQFAAVFEAEGAQAEAAWRAIMRRLGAHELAQARFDIGDAPLT